MLPLDFLDSLHDVLEGDRLIVRVDAHDNPLLALRPQGPPALRTPSRPSDSSDRINTIPVPNGPYNKPKCSANSPVPIHVRPHRADTFSPHTTIEMLPILDF